MRRAFALFPFRRRHGSHARSWVRGPGAGGGQLGQAPLDFAAAPRGGKRLAPPCSTDGVRFASLSRYGKGLSQSALPYRRSVPTWLKLTSDDVKEQIYKLAKKGLTPSQIGVILRDSHGVAQVRFVTGNKILRILKSKGLAPDLPEDLYHLIKTAVAVRKHLERNRKDKDAKFRLILIESRIHRLARYYKSKRVLPPNWKYESSTASALVA
ncbi:small ribosomal subunit protein uS15 isoform X1 [Scyliorhinus torazame]|uniref:small ribosomal subunit protein uS15 isoform X1 n=1 Tax=Scyliorhinus torazame TaxID=75743 RepID=UPI003B5C02C3